MHQFHRIRAIRKYGHPHFWGVTRLDIREGALERKNFEISDVELFFDDGNLVSFPGNAVLSARSFDDAWVDGEKPFTVYLGLRKWNAEGNNVTVMDDPVTTSINTMLTASNDPEELPDMLGNGPVAQIKPMYYVLRLFWETELAELGDYHLIPVARLVLDGEQVRVDRSFIPPCLTLAGSKALTDIYKDITDQVASRCRRLEEYKNPGGLGHSDLDFTSTVFLLALRTLNRYAPALKHLCDAPHIHPWEAFGLLRQCIGELSSFSRDVSSLGVGVGGRQVLPDYDHENPGPCFEAARAIITRILDSLTAGPEFMAQFVFDDPFFTADMPDRAFGPGNTFWLLVRTDDPDTALPEIERMAKLSATKGMSALLARAVHGIPFVHEENPPPGLPRTRGALVFRVDATHPMWEEVEATKSLSLYWDSAPKEMAAYIAALRG